MWSTNFFLIGLVLFETTTVAEVVVVVVGWWGGGERECTRQRFL